MGWGSPHRPGSKWAPRTSAVDMRVQGYSHIVFSLVARGLLPYAGVCQAPLRPVPWELGTSPQMPMPAPLSLTAGWQETGRERIPHPAPSVEFSPLALGQASSLPFP